MMGWSPRCYIPSFMEIGQPVPEKKIFKGFLPYMSMAAILVMWPASCHQIFISLKLKAFIKKIGSDRQSCFRGFLVLIFVYMTFGQGQEMMLTFNTHLPSYIQLDDCSY